MPKHNQGVVLYPSTIGTGLGAGRPTNRASIPGQGKHSEKTRSYRKCVKEGGWSSLSNSLANFGTGSYKSPSSAVRYVLGYCRSKAVPVFN